MHLIIVIKQKTKVWLLLFSLKLYVLILLLTKQNTKRKHVVHFVLSIQQYFYSAIFGGWPEQSNPVMWATITVNHDRWRRIKYNIFEKKIENPSCVLTMVFSDNPKAKHASHDRIYAIFCKTMILLCLEQNGSPYCPYCNPSAHTPYC